MENNNKEQKRRDVEEKVKNILVFLFLPYLKLDRPEEEAEKKALIVAAAVFAGGFLLSMFFSGILQLLCLFGYVAVLVLSWMLLASRNNP